MQGGLTHIYQLGVNSWAASSSLGRKFPQGVKEDIPLLAVEYLCVLTSYFSLLSPLHHLEGECKGYII